MSDPAYRGRLAPSPSGLLHLGHARTFWIAEQRARAAGGALILRSDDLDAARFRLDFAEAMMEDLRWLGFSWDEGPDVGGPHAPYEQSRTAAALSGRARAPSRGGIHYLRAPAPGATSWRRRAPPTRRSAQTSPSIRLRSARTPGRRCRPSAQRISVNWRFRVPDGQELFFDDGRLGPQAAVAGRAFGDFPVWRKDDGPSYQLACVVDDAAMGVTEVVRGEDLVLSTFRQLLLYRALGRPGPRFYHCALLSDERGLRLAKRHDALSLRAMRERGEQPEAIRAAWLRAT